MVSVSPRTWTTKRGARRRGYQLTWYDVQKVRHRELFTGESARSKAAERRRELELALTADTRAAVAIGVSGAPAGAGITIRSAGDRWVRYVERELKRDRSTWSHYEQQLADHICSACVRKADATDPGKLFGDLAVSDVRAPDVEALKDALLVKLGPSMTARMLTLVRMLFNDIERRGEVVANPARAVKVREIDRGEDEVEIPEETEAKALVAAVTIAEPAPASFTEVWVLTTIFSGLRPSENRGLAIEDLVLDGEKPGLQVRRRADEWGQLGPVKTRNARRFVPLPPRAIALLRRWLLVVPRGHRLDDSAIDGVADPENPGRRIHLVFPTSLGTVQRLANIYNRVWVPAMAKAGLIDWRPVSDAAGAPKLDEAGREITRAAPRYSVNCLRHFNASLLIAEGWDPKTIQRRLGHGSIQVTFDLYGHLFAKRATDPSAIARIEQKLLG